MQAEAKKERWKLGDGGWEVEWCSNLPRCEDDPESCDHDQATYEFRDFRNQQEAMTFAKEIYPKDQYGSVRITRFVLDWAIPGDPHCGIEKQYADDADYYDGDSP